MLLLKLSINYEGDDMWQVEFNYPVGAQMAKVVASCKSIVADEYDPYVTGLTLTFLDKDDVPIKVDYDKEIFEEIEDEAMLMLSELYYNPELNFQNTH